VIAPLVEEEYRRADQVTRSAFRRAKSVLSREATLTSERQRAQISRLLHLSPLLHTTYELRQRLAQLCSRRSGDMDERLRALTQWCLDAEATGIGALQEFVQHLKSYTMPAVVARR
jgi:stearoyl-CoA desaturase (Delta-9 desaturase)